MRDISSFDVSASVRPCAVPVYLPGGKSGALLIHGFTGYPADLGLAGRYLNQAGFTVSIPRLPGHGTTARDFAATSAGDWLRRCVDAYQDLGSRCDRIFIAGHSMGGLLAIIMSALFRPERIALLAPALETSNRLLPLTPFMRHFLKKIPARREIPVNDPDEEFFRDEYWSFRWLGPSAEFYAIQRTARRCLSKVEADTLLILAQGDTTVSMGKTAETIERRISAKKLKKIVLENSRHRFTNGPEKEKVAEAVVEWFSAH